jgi:hypothetical protein
LQCLLYGQVLFEPAVAPEVKSQHHRDDKHHGAGN